MWPGAPMRSPRMPARSSIACAAQSRAAGAPRSDLRLPRRRHARRRDLRRLTMKTTSQHIRASITRTRPAELFAGLGAAGAVDVGRAEAEIPARRCGGSPRRSAALDQSRRLGAGRADRAAQPDHGQPDRGQHLRDHAATWSPPIRCVHGGRDRAHAPPFRGGAAAGRRRPSPAPTPWSNGARVDMARGRRGADAVVVLARPCQRERRDRLLDRFSRHAVHSAQRGDVLRAQSRRASRPITRSGPSPHAHSVARGTRAGNATRGRWRSPKTRCRPSACTCMRLPSGTPPRGRQDHGQSLYSVISGKARVRSMAERTKRSRSAT